MTDFDTSSITIRATEPEDHERVKSIYEQPGAFGTLMLPYPTASSWKERINRTPPNAHTLLALIDETAVGHIGFVPAQNPRRKHVAEIGMAVHDSYVGLGIGQKLMSAVIDLADNWLNFSRIELTVYVDNERAINLYRRNGFEIEGTHQKYAFRAGELVDCHAMARVKTRE